MMPPKHQHRIRIFFLFTLFIAPQISATENVSFVLSYRRFLQFTPCQCSLYPYGGIQREFNALSRLRDKEQSAHVVPLTVGASLVPNSNDFDLGNAHKDAKRMIEAMNSLQTLAFVPGSEDLRLGIIKLLSLSRQAKFTFLSANIVDSKKREPLFKPFLELTNTPIPIVLIGLTSKRQESLMGRELMISEPEVALNESLKKCNDGQKRMIVVLSDLSRSERSKLQTRHPEVTLWLGGDDLDQHDLGYDQISLKSVYGTTQSSGRRLLRVTLKLDKETSLERLFWEEMVEPSRKTIDYFKETGMKKTDPIFILKTELSQTPKQKDILRYEIEDIGLSGAYDKTLSP